MLELNYLKNFNLKNIGLIYFYINHRGLFNTKPILVEEQSWYYLTYVI